MQRQGNDGREPSENGADLRDAPVRILLVEDEDGDAYLVRHMLAEERLSLCTIAGRTTTLRDATTVLGRERFDAVLLDLNLPDSWGLDTVRALCGHCTEAPVVVLTGLRDEELARRSIREGAQDFLVKGEFDGRLLVKTVRHAIERHRLRTRLEELTPKLSAAAPPEADTDPLTGLYGRRLFLELAKQQLKLARRHKRSLTLFLFDIDRLKAISDGFGRSAGDQVVVEMGDLLRQTCRDSDILARVGEDKLVALAIDAGNGAPIEGRLQSNWAARRVAAGRPFPLRYSCGRTTVLPEQDCSPEGMLQMAAQAMLAGKRKNRDAGC